MTKYRIKAYFMHEHEQDAAKEAVTASVIKNAEWTAGYVMGVVDKAAIKSLSKKGLVISLVEEIASHAEDTVALGDSKVPFRMAARRSFSLDAALVKTAGGRRVRRLPVSKENRTTKQKILSQDSNRENFYIVRFHGAITEERRKELKEGHIKLLERLSRSKYKVKLKPSQVTTLAGMPFVDCLRLYTEEDTLLVPRTEVVPTAGRSKRELFKAAGLKVSATGPKQRTLLYSVRLHKSKDMPAVVRWLKKRNLKPLSKLRDQLQVALVEDSKTLTDLVSRPEVATVQSVEAPRLCDGVARTLLGLTRKSLNLGLEGEGEIIGIADTGIDNTHPDLKNRIKGVSAWGRTGDSSDPDGHGTHVAGCAVGDGTSSKGEVMGAAPQAKVFFQSILDKEGRLGGLSSGIEKLLEEAYAKGARIHNNSWGAFSFAGYTDTSYEVDRFVAAHPDMLVIIAAGNDGLGIPRKAGSKMSSAKGFVDWPCVAAPATSKNALTVGASRSSRTTGGYAELTWNDAWPDRYPHPPISQELISSDDQSLAAFSSRGPSIDFRIKPDVVAPGTDIAAAKSKLAPLYKFWGAYPGNEHYGFMGGTSMAAPYVAGCAALVREWYRKEGKWETPSAALLKATLINGTRRIAGVDSVAELVGEPNFHQGFGRIDMSNTIPSPLTPKLKLVFDDPWKDASRTFSKSGDVFRYQVKVGKGLPLRVCLAWTDFEANALQHRLQLQMDNDDQTKWVGNAGVPSRLNIAGAFPDQTNNVQVVRVETPAPGNYTIAVFADSLLKPSQTFALVVTGDLKSELKRI